MKESLHMSLWHDMRLVYKDIIFMIFARDNISEILLQKSACVFVAASTKNDLSKIVFNEGNLEGSLGKAVHADSFLHQISTDDND
ncbi:hypothetical protein L596_028232 [Steinernema carpocapsae]|uniref:Uncharacterized protein n=1 Tax=Steinernema carpocapsae TaxID=34508 RepID=A0A4U5LXU2_STECR|nr:hypothetical protein L596_028232 [Steinernema carpocapsae]